MIDYPVPALQYKNLVYARNLKCASTFFYNNFVEMGWQPLWLAEAGDDCTVFSHIMDPVQRRHQGLAEYIDMCGLTEDYIRDSRLQNLLATAPVLDRHSLSYEHSFGARADSMTWIPIQGTAHDTVTRTQQWIQAQGHEVDFSNRMHLHVHAGDPAKKQLVRLLEQNWQQAATLKPSRSLQQIWQDHYNGCRDPSWPDAPAWQNFNSLPDHIRKELAEEYPEFQIQISPDLASVKILPDECPSMALTTETQKIFKKDLEIWHQSLKNFGLAI